MNDRFYRLMLITLLNSLACLPVSAQRVLNITAEAGTFGLSAGRTPFWLRSNQYGIVPLNKPLATLRLKASIDYDSLRLFARRLTYGGGVSVVGNTGTAGNWLLPEAYLKARLGVVEFYAGRWREHVGLADSTLSTGSYAWSGNALPVPKLQFEIRSFTPIGFTKGFIAVKGSFAHGWLGGRYVQHALLHQKSLYIRLGKPQSRFKGYAGLNHQVVWGGQSQDLVKTGLVKSPQLPASIRDYLSLVSGLRAVQTGVVDTANYADFDLTNRVGNHLGSVDFAVELTTNRFQYYLYRENPYETGAFFYGTSFADGLNGLRIRSTNPKAIIQQVVVEYLNTTNQGGSEFIISDPRRRGRVNYFNNSQFRDGWSYGGLTIGTPFIPPALGPHGELPYGSDFTNDNRVRVWHIGITGTLLSPTRRWLAGPALFQSKLSYSYNLGTYTNPFQPLINQFSGIVTVLVPLTALGGLQINTSLGVDRGGLYPVTTGFYVGLRKVWSSTTRQ